MSVPDRFAALRYLGRRAAWRAGQELKRLVNPQPDEPDFRPVTYSYYLREVAALGITATLLPNQVLRLQRGERIHNLYGSHTDFDGTGSLRVAGDKALGARLLEQAGVPVPPMTVLAAGDLAGARDFQRRMGEAVVIKPAGNTGDSLGVSVKPRGPAGLRRAVRAVSALGPQFLIEQFVAGTNYRLLFCRHRFLAAAARLPAAVTGDGRRTIRELLAAANAGRLPRGQHFAFDARPRPLLYRIEEDADLRAALAAQQLRATDVPAAGVAVPLQLICHWLRGGEYRDVTDDLHPELIDVCRRATLATGTKLAGVDLIAQDRRNPTPGSYVVNEVNTTPGVLVHYEVQNQDKLRPVARDILRAMFD